jgi:hypothetical protein
MTFGKGDPAARAIDANRYPPGSAAGAGFHLKTI